MTPSRSPKARPPYSGFVLAFEPRRTEKIAAQLGAFGEAAESFSAMDWDFERREIVFVVLSPDDASISGAVLMERMHGSGGTGKLKMRLGNPVLLEPAIEAEALREVFPLLDNVSTAERLRRIDPEAWSKLIASIKELRPETAAPLAALISKRGEEERLLGDTQRIARLAEQRDAIGMTLEIADMDRQKVLRSFDATRMKMQGLPWTSLTLNPCKSRT